MEDLINNLSSPNLDIRHKAEILIAEQIRENPEVIQIVIQKIRDGDMNIRWYLSRSLIIAGETVIPTLIAKSEKETDATVQRYLGAILATFKEKAVPSLISLFSSTNPLARGMAGAALEKIGQSAHDALLEAANSPNATVRSCAGIVLMKFGVYQY
ncbi:MAG TPA: hypothetical protein O0X32_01400 [Methanocorpusculum sp.]|nr:hypothetical protein [Methanocorpusculum sp.]